MVALHTSLCRSCNFVSYLIVRSTFFVAGRFGLKNDVTTSRFLPVLGDSFKSDFDRVFVDLFVTNIEVTVARLNGARLPEPTDIPLRVVFPPRASSNWRNIFRNLNEFLKLIYNLFDVKKSQFINYNSSKFSLKSQIS